MELKNFWWHIYCVGEPIVKNHAILHYCIGGVLLRFRSRYLMSCLLKCFLWVWLAYDNLMCKIIDKVLLFASWFSKYIYQYLKTQWSYSVCLKLSSDHGWAKLFVEIWLKIVILSNSIVARFWVACRDFFLVECMVSAEGKSWCDFVLAWRDF